LVRLAVRGYDSLIGGPGNGALRNAIQEGTLRFTYKGIPCWKDPFDLALYSMLLWREKPKTIIEIGSAYGGSAAWFLDQQVVMGILPRIVISIDLKPPRAEIPGLVFLQGNALDLGSALSEDWLATQMPRPLLVIEDGAHEPETTLAVLRFFDQWLQPGELIVIEDGNADELYPGRHKRGGPLAGVAEFMAERRSSYGRAGEYCDFFGQNVTWSPDGYWRRIG
jgi:cephalosporin hydroxylase